jgi:hypothetical protein
MVRMEDLEETRRQCRSAWRSRQGAIPSSKWVYLRQAGKSCIWWIPTEVRWQ